MKRAYSLLTIKAINEEERTIEGIASTPTADRMGDIVESKGAKFALPIPLLWQHNAEQPIGMVNEAQITRNGIRIKASIAKGVLPMIDEAWALIKAGLVRGLSIGFQPLENGMQPIEGSKYGVRFTAWEWLELSAVTIPANSQASIQTIKSIDAQFDRPASGSLPVIRVEPIPGAAGTTPQLSKGMKMKTITEQIAGFEAKRAASSARMNDIMAKSAEEGRTLDEVETDEYDTLESEVTGVDTHLVRLRAHEQIMIKNAVAVVEPKNEDEARAVRSGGTILTLKSNLPKGTAFTRYAIALLKSNGNLPQALEISKQWHDSSPEVEIVLKAAVAAGTTTDATWARPLIPYNQMANEFVELLRPQTILGRIPGFRRVPFAIRMPRATAGSTAGWVGEGAPKPVSRMSFDTMTMPFTKVAAIIVLTEELIRFSSPSAEAVVQDDMIKAISQFIDVQFVDPSIAANGAISPASITNGAAISVSTGPTIAEIEADTGALMQVFITGNIMAGVWIMNPRTALALSKLRTPQDVKFYPDITMAGGTFQGLPVITSNNVPIAVDGTTFIVLMDASEVFLADDGGVTLDVSREASLQMSDAPAGGPQQLVSLWQNNMVGLRAEREINWQRRRNASVAVLTAVAY